MLAVHLLLLPLAVLAQIAPRHESESPTESRHVSHPDQASRIPAHRRSFISMADGVTSWYQQYPFGLPQTIGRDDPTCSSTSHAGTTTSSVISTSEHSITTTATFFTTITPSTTSLASVSGSILSVNKDACASISKLTNNITNILDLFVQFVPAEDAYECLNSVPFNQSAATSMMDALRPYINWQTTISYLKTPPAEYVSKVQPPHDFWACFDAIYGNASAGRYESEYAFALDLHHAFHQAHDGHFQFTPKILGGVFGFIRDTPLVSVSVDGWSLPKVYVYADILANVSGNASFIPSPVTHIDGRNATDFLLEWSQCQGLQDRDALWNSLFYSPAQHASPHAMGVGTFSADCVSYPGPSTTLSFKNGTSVTNKNIALSVLSLDRIESGADLYENHLAINQSEIVNALKIVEQAEALSNSSSSDFTTTSRTAQPSSPASSAPASSTGTPGYPKPEISHSKGFNRGYYVHQPGYENIAVLTVGSFGSDSKTNVSEFQRINAQFIADALAANKTKLIIDVSANGGGLVLQAYDLFKQLFPSILPYGARRFRAHESLNSIGQEYSRRAGRGIQPSSITTNTTDPELELQMALETAQWNYRNDLNVNNKPFKSWAEKFGPHQHGPSKDNFTSTMRFNLSDELILSYTGRINASIYLNHSTDIAPPFATENIVLVSDGHCSSTCAVFTEFMRQQAGVKTVALGGRPNYDLIQAVGGVKGSQAMPLSAIYAIMVPMFLLGNKTERKLWNSTELGQYTNLPFLSDPTSGVNVCDGIREGDGTNTPLQFVYEPADCRVFYTPEMVIDQSVVWRVVADTVWGNTSACVNADKKFTGLYRDNEISQRRYEISPDLDIEAAWRGLNVQTWERSVSKFGAIVST